MRKRRKQIVIHIECVSQDTLDFYCIQTDTVGKTQFPDAFITLCLPSDSDNTIEYSLYLECPDFLSVVPKKIILYVIRKLALTSIQQWDKISATIGTQYDNIPFDHNKEHTAWLVRKLNESYTKN